MSATDILNALKTLSPGEQAAFDRLFRQWQSSATKPMTKSGKWPDFRTRLHGIYGDKVAGDSQSLINELRGDR